jgi:DNA-binding winged helix-turn-helix (wHTH) protein/TolB-like protein/Flp pilus assembly protein TadD
MNKKAGRLYEFGPFRLDVAEHRLLRDQDVVPLSPKVFETLLVLVEHGGHVLEKDELMRSLWPDSFVEESSLTQSISLLRKALGEGGGQQFIETVPKLGYRFVAQVRAIEASSNGGVAVEAGLPRTEATAAAEGEAHGGEPARGEQLTLGELPKNPTASLSEAHARPLSESRMRRLSRSRLLSCAAALLLLAIIAGGVYFRAAKTTEPKGGPDTVTEGGVRSLAVLPFKSLGGEGGDEFLGLGVADALIIKLGNFEQLNVRPTSSVIKYAGREYDAQPVGKELGVDAVLDGTIQHAGERVRVTVVLLSVRDGRVLWSGKFDERFTDIFALQDSISERVANVLQLQLAAGRQAQLNKRFTENAEAYSYYATGLYFWNKRTREGLTKAIEYFRKATETDRHYASAYAMLADSYCLTVYYGYNVLPRREALQNAEEAVSRALELDDTLAEAHTVMGAVEVYRGDFSAAEQSYKRAIELNPNSAMARYRYGFDLLAMLEIEDAIPEMRRAQELDPVSLPINTTLAACLVSTGQYDEAIRYSKLALEIEPQFGWARANLAEAYGWKGMLEEAEAEYRKLTEQQDFRLRGELGLVSVYARSGRQVEARRLLSEVKAQYGSEEAFPELPFEIALAYAALDKKDEAFVWLERAVESRRARGFDLRYSRQLDTLKSDPRYARILRRHGYAESMVAELSKQSLPETSFNEVR